LKGHHPSQVKISSVVKAELLYGARKSGRPPQNLRLLRDFFAPFRSLPFDDACAEQYGVIRAELARSGTLIGPYDMMIAATAMAHDVTLVTHNVDEFSRVVGLKWEDWEETA
jgi:tRNA(fMet)-specific endonuclease VapC